MSAPEDWMTPGRRIRAATRQTLAQHRRAANGRFVKLPSQREITHAGLRAELGMAAPAAPRAQCRSIPALPPIAPPPIAPQPGRKRRLDRFLPAAVAACAVLVAIVVAIPVTWPALAAVAVVNMRAAVTP